MEPTSSRWAGRFIGMTFALGGVAWVIFALLVLGNVLAGTGNYALGPASSRIVAGGGAGSWFTMGILAYLIVAVGGTGFTAFFYQHIEGTMGSALAGGRSIGAWIHLTLGSLGSAGASLIMAWGGFQAGTALLTTDVGRRRTRCAVRPHEHPQPARRPDRGPDGNRPARLSCRRDRLGLRLDGGPQKIQGVLRRGPIGGRRTRNRGDGAQGPHGDTHPHRHQGAEAAEGKDDGGPRKARGGEARRE